MSQSSWRQSHCPWEGGKSSPVSPLLPASRGAELSELLEVGFCRGKGWGGTSLGAVLGRMAPHVPLQPAPGAGARGWAPAEPAVPLQGVCLPQESVNLFALYDGSCTSLMGLGLCCCRLTSLLSDFPLPLIFNVWLVAALSRDGSMGSRRNQMVGFF